MFIGIDLGTSSIKTILADEDQKIICQANEIIKLLNPKAGYYEQDPNSWYDATIKCFQILKKEFPKEFSSVEAIGISGQMHGATLIDKNNSVLRPCILWNDTRSAGQCVKMEKKYPLLRKESGNIAMPGFTAPKILWIKENEYEVFKKIYKILLPKDYLRLKLTDSYYSDMSDASGTLWLDVQNRKWSEKLLDLTSLNISHMPLLVEGSEPTSFLSNKIKNKFGFNKNVIVAGGAGDQSSGAIGSGVISSKQSMISLGTSGVYFSPTSEFSSNTNKAIHSFCHCLPNTWHHMSVMLSATNCLNWICGINGIHVKDAIKKAEFFFKESFLTKTTPFFLPYLSGERTPHNNPHLRGSFHLLGTETSLESMIYSVIEGICFGIKDGFEAVHENSLKSKEIYLVGGGSKSVFWADLLSSILNERIIVGEDSNFGAAIGASRLAMLSTGRYKKSDIILNMKRVRECQPSKEILDQMQNRYRRWNEIVNVNNLIAKKIIEK